MLEGREIWKIKLPLKGNSPEVRAANIETRLKAFAKDYSIPVDHIKVVDSDISTDIAADYSILILFTNEDAAAEGITRVALAERVLPKVKQAVTYYRESHSSERLLRSAGEALLATIIFFLAAWVINKIFRKLMAYAGRYRIPGAEAHTLNAFLLNLLRTIRFIIILALLYIYLQSSLGFFPWTRQLSLKLFSYIIDPLHTLAASSIQKIPDLLFLCVLAFVVFYFLKFLRLLFYLIETNRIQVPGFYQEWAKPTYRIVRGLVIAFALIVAFPYVPGSNTEAFKGISIFAGVLFSLGSTSAISNMIAGMILTYMRPYKTGDWVMIGNTLGIVTEMSFLVTRIHTAKNEEISVANSIVLGQEITNYSSMASHKGLIVHTSVTIGYSAPWRKVHELLISAALASDGIRAEPQPFVLQTALSDFYPVYELNAYTDVPSRSNSPQDLQLLYSALHKNIQDKFNEAGVEIMSPHYTQLRDGNELAVPASYIPRDHVPSALRVFIDSVKPEPKK